ncbi:MAG: TetR/AcrR family transcriptional regulator [Saprospiraceae bacterium]
MAIIVTIAPNDQLYLRDPQSSDLGKRILENSCLELHRLGLEELTFKKLAKAIGCTEASVYRYFSSKQQLLQYLVAYYWDWVHFLIDTSIAPLLSPEDRLRAAVKSLTEPMKTNMSVPYIDEQLLYQIVLTEGQKAYHFKSIDTENDKGIFLGYKALTEKLATLIAAVNPKFPYPRALASSLFEMAHNHTYFAEHLPRLTDLSTGKGFKSELEKMLQFWVDSLLRV